MSRDPIERLAGWGRLFFPGRERCPEDLREVSKGAHLTRGLGRSYGDSSVPADGGEALGSRRADRFLSLDQQRGRLVAEAGLSLRTMNRVLLPQGWFTPVTPGTQDVTLGGMVAADVHGKNHHVAGSFGRHVRELLLRVGNGDLVRCSREQERDLFLATLGGMGLTGHILEVTVDLEKVASGWIERESVGTANLEESIQALLELGERWPYTVGWIDCLISGAARGRGVIEGGAWCAAEAAPTRVPAQKAVREVPFVAPNFLINPLSLGLYNRFRYRRHGRRRRVERVPYEEFFYPLDAIGNWSRLYGRRGLTQYQCVLPRAAGREAVGRFLDRVRELGGTPYLVVLKDFGEQGEGLLSFPQPGFTLAVDFAVGAKTPGLVAALDDFVLALEGRIYLAKEAFTAPERFRAMEGQRLDRFLGVCRQWDPDRRLGSRQWRRLIGGGPRAADPADR